MTEAEFDRLLTVAFQRVAEEELREIEKEETVDIDLSDRFKKRTNRLFRERVGSKKVPHPEVDNAWERFKSFWMKMFFDVYDNIERKNRQRKSDR